MAAFDLNKLSSISVGLASPETILSWSHGEVLNAETINYRSQKPVEGGLFCERIFGPTKDYECHCGKIKRMKYSGTVCDKCGVEITTKAVRRERMGHIALACPCTHIWYFKGTPNRVAFLLDIQPKQLEEVCYFVSHIVMTPGSCPLMKKYDIYDEKTAREKFKEILNAFLYDDDPLIKPDNEDYNYVLELIETLEDPKNTFDFNEIAYLINRYTKAEFGFGAEAIKKLLKELDITEEFNKVQAELRELIASQKNRKDGKVTKSQKKERLVKRLEVIKSFYDSKQDPSWMILDNLPVIPPDLRPMLQLDGGRFATSDLNDLYRKVITRNLRLKEYINLNSPSTILVNEKRMLQEAIDALIDNSKRNKPVQSSNNRVLKSLTSALKGKQGRFRQNLLGKRVDYSGRSVIAVGPDLKMYQCGLPREMAILLFRPFIAHELMERQIASSHKVADQMIDRYDSRVNDVIEDIISDYYVLLNRAPTLHRLGIQAFQPVIVEGRAIRLHPLVCTGFNADFDGDQMSVHVPLSQKAQKEAGELMIANHNILGPKDGKPICIPTQDMVLGNYYLTIEYTRDDYDSDVKDALSYDDKEKAEMLEFYKNCEGKLFASINDVYLAYQTKQIDLHTRILLRGSSLDKDNLTEEQKNSFIVTTVGKVIFNSIFPKDFPFINDEDKIRGAGVNLKSNLDEYFIKVGDQEDLTSSIKTAKDVKEYIHNLPVRTPISKKGLGPLINEIFLRYGADKTSKILDDIKDQGFDYSTIAGFTVSIDDIKVLEGKDELVKEASKKADAIMSLYDDGEYSERGKHDAIVKIWEDVKGKVESQLKAILKKEKKNPVFMMANSGARGSIGNFVSLLGIRGCMVNPKGEIIEIPITSNFREGANVSEYFIASHGARKGGTDTALKTADSGYLTRRLIDVSHNVIVREEDCGCDHGVKVRALVEVIDSGDKNNVKEIISLRDRIAGRFTMKDVVDPRTGEVIIKGNEFITEEIADKIAAAGIEEVEIRSVLTCESKDGVCVHCYGRNMATGNMVEVGDAVGIIAAQSIGEPGTQLTLKNFHSGGTTGADITQGLPRVQELLEARNPKAEATISPICGVVTEISDVNNVKLVRIKNEYTGEEKEVETNYGLKMKVSVGDRVTNGQALTQGAIDPKKLLEYADYRAVQDYIITEIQKVYSEQAGIAISDKHLECIVRQMTRKGIVLDSGDTEFLPGMRAEINDFTDKNLEAFKQGKRPARIKPILLGITKAALDTKSFLSSASFQETTKVLTDAAVKNKVDYLVGLKENVMVGKLIPAGTGIKPLASFAEDDEDDYMSDRDYAIEHREEQMEVDDSDKELLSVIDD